MKSSNQKAYKHQLLCGMADGFNALIMGASLGYTSPALVSMSHDATFRITAEQGNWIGAIVPGMALVGSLIAGPLAESYGSRFILLATFFPNLLTWLRIATAESAFSVIAARFVTGLMLGFQQVGISLYLSETVDPKIRPVCSIFPSVLGAIGFMAINLPPSLLSWRELAYFGGILCLPLFLIFLYLPETPYYLLKTGKKEKAFANFEWFRGSESDAQQELKELQKAGIDNKSTEPTLSEMFRPPNRWPMCISILLFVFQQFTGISALSSFMGLIFEQAESNVNASTCSLLMTFLNISVVAFASKLFAKYPRILFIKYSSIFMSAALSLLSFYLVLKDSSGIFKEISSYLAFIPLFSFICYFMAFSMGWGPIPWMFLGDGLPLKIRSKGASLGVAACWFFNFLVTKSFSWGIIYIGLWGIIMVYILLTIIGWLIMNYFLPETFGFSPYQLDKYYSGGYKKKEKLH